MEGEVEGGVEGGSGERSGGRKWREEVEGGSGGRDCWKSLLFMYCIM